MARFVLKHSIFLTATLLVVSFIVFAMNEFAPGDVARKILGAYATQEQVDHLTREMGLDRPLLVRYVEYLGKLARGDLGYSTRLQGAGEPDHLEPARQHAASSPPSRSPASSRCPCCSESSPACGKARRSTARSSSSAPWCASVPEFAMGVFLASLFVVGLGWLPGTATLVAGGGWSVASQFVLPVAVIVLYDCGYVVSMIRTSMVEVMQRPYIRTAVLKGMRFRRVVLGHALRNAMINPVTVILLQLNYLISGVVVVETVFAYPGFGRMMLEAALFKDIALIEMGALVAVFVAVLTQILGDLGYMLLDPRIRA